jgi:hypothetical protein
VRVVVVVEGLNWARLRPLPAGLVGRAVRLDVGAVHSEHSSRARPILMAPSPIPSRLTPGVLPVRRDQSPRTEFPSFNINKEEA